MPDTLANQAARPQSRSQKGGCGFPIMRVVGLFDLMTGVWVAAATGCYRTTEFYLASTILEPKQMSAAKMGELYLRRWLVELFIDDLKTTLGMAVLSTRSPAMIRRELIIHIIGYNLLRSGCNSTWRHIISNLVYKSSPSESLIES